MVLYIGGHDSEVVHYHVVCKYRLRLGYTFKSYVAGVILSVCHPTRNCVHLHHRYTRGKGLETDVPT